MNVLLYADDIVAVAPSTTCLQHMIQKVETHSEVWSLQVNLDKSKIMVFRKDGKLGNKDKIYMIEVVNHYMYLGIILTPILSWEKHFEDKIRSSKLSINMVWGGVLINNTKVPLSS